MKQSEVKSFRKNASQFKKAKSGREGAITRVLIMASMAFLVFTTAAMSLLYFGLFYLQPKIEQDPYYTVYVTGIHFVSISPCFFPKKLT